MAIEIPKKLAPGSSIPVSRQLRGRDKHAYIKSLEKRGHELVALLAELDRRGFDADVVIRKKRGRPSDVARFLSKQDDLL